MKLMKVFPVCLLIIFLAYPTTAPAQTGDKVVILNPRVGAVITKEQRDFFHLFPLIEGFSQAIFYQTPDSQYYASITRIYRNSQSRDTIVHYSETSVLRHAEMIEHFEAIADGNYRMGDTPARFQVVGGSEVVRKPHQDAAVRSGLLKDYDKLPLAETADEVFLDNYPDWGCGFGISACQVDLSSFADAFTKLENKYRSQGFSVGQNTLTTNLSSLLWYSIRVRFSRSVIFQLEAGKSSGDDNVMVEAVSGTFMYRFDNLATSRLFPYLGIGINVFRISGEQRYGDRISKIDSTQTYSGSPYYTFSYTVIQTVSAEGTQEGLSLIAGVDMDLDPSFSLTPFVTYYALPAMETQLSSGEVAHIRMSGMAIGAKLTLNF